MSLMALATTPNAWPNNWTHRNLIVCPWFLAPLTLGSMQQLFFSVL